MTVDCAVTNCKKKRRFRFPKDQQLRKKWLLCIGRPDFCPKESDGLCEVHFLPSDFIVESSYTGAPLLNKKRLKTGTVPIVVFEVEEPEVKKLRVECPSPRRSITPEPSLPARNESDLGVEMLPASNSDLDVVSSSNVILSFVEDGLVTETVDTEESSAVGSKSVKVEVATQTEVVKTYDVKLQTTERLAPYTVSDFINKPHALHDLTGLECYDRFLLVLNSLTPNILNLQYRKSKVQNVSIPDQLFLTLWKLRKHPTDVELGIHFGIHHTTVSNIFHSFITFMSNCWGKLDIWPSREMIDYYMPEGFRKSYPSTRVIVDGTEVGIEKPTNPRAQQASFSTYKNKNTVKAVIGGAPSGLISYCSEAYGGSTSDRQIVERSALLQLCEQGDSIMADRGFNVQDIFAVKGVAVNIPAFLKGKDHLPGMTIMKDRKLASKRVHIERLIGLAKTYKMLAGTLSHHHTAIASEIFFVTVMLCNFKECVVSKKA